MNNFKYIIFEGTTGFDGIIFPPYIEHDCMALKFASWKPLSAGFIKVFGDGIECYGKSVSLNLHSQPGDEMAFEHLIN